MVDRGGEIMSRKSAEFQSGGGRAKCFFSGSCNAVIQTCSCFNMTYCTSYAWRVHMDSWSGS